MCGWGIQNQKRNAEENGKVEEALKRKRIKEKNKVIRPAWIYFFKCKTKEYCRYCFRECQAFD